MRRRAFSWWMCPDFHMPAICRGDAAAKSCGPSKGIRSIGSLQEVIAPIPLGLHRGNVEKDHHNRRERSFIPSAISLDMQEGMGY